VSAEHGLDSPGAQLLIERGLKASAFTTWMGTRLTRFGDGVVEIELDLRPELTQHHGQAHGAVLGYLADTVAAWAASSVVGDVVTAEYKLNLLTAARGEVLRARGEVIRAGRRQVIVRSDVYARSGETETHVATALATIVPVGDRGVPVGERPDAGQ
jgi:uncharacterized protein (TIGR00369 family)